VSYRDDASGTLVGWLFVRNAIPLDVIIVMYTGTRQRVFI